MSNYGETADCTLTQTITVADCELSITLRPQNPQPQQVIQQPEPEQRLESGTSRCGGEESEQGVTFCAVPPCATGCEEEERGREDGYSNNREDSSSRHRYDSGVGGCEDDSEADGRENDSGGDSLQDDDGQGDNETGRTAKKIKNSVRMTKPTCWQLQDGVTGPVSC
ncbi:unnamed protein product [Phytophthora fragariaefolia]|uniref:Unnamed protein product n=1 Tax=Phytophthora fragariaefolia TaxID=1490495 RepID=A0A9W6TWG2_9STRA|nr:unnamed protein product [Phytophthora fragariaefolia]